MMAWKSVAVWMPAAWKQARKGGMMVAVVGGCRRRVPRMYSRIWALVDRVIGGMMKKIFESQEPRRVTAEPDEGKERGRRNPSGLEEDSKDENSKMQAWVECCDC